MAHAKLGPSGFYKWGTCPGSLALEQAFPDSGSEFARVGTIAHEVAEAALVAGGDPWPHPALDEKMMDCVRDYVAYVRNLSGVKEYEVRLKLTEDIWGTADCVAFHEDTLHVIDLKTGQGVRVEVEDNPQLKLYGLMAAKMYAPLYDFKRVVLHIVQPPLNNFGKWEISHEELLAWEAEVMKAAAAALAPDAPFNPSEKACQFCRAKLRCNARAEHNQKTVAGEFLPKQLLTDDEIAALLAVASERQKWYADLQSHALKEAERGHKWPGYKLVEGRSNRKYSDPDAVAGRLTENGIAEALIFERSLLGITDMEKTIGKKRFAELLSDLVTKPRGKPTLVPATDPRPEIDDAIEGFTNQEQSA